MATTDESTLVNGFFVATGPVQHYALTYGLDYSNGQWSVLTSDKDHFVGRISADSRSDAVAKIDALEKTLSERGFTTRFEEHAAGTSGDPFQAERANVAGPDRLDAPPEDTHKPSQSASPEARAAATSPDSSRPEPPDSDLEPKDGQTNLARVHATEPSTQQAKPAVNLYA